MTQRDLPISEPTTTEPPTISEPVTTIGEWANGLSDHITDDEKHRLMLMFGLTVDPDVLSINGRQHILEMLDDDQI